MTTQQQAWESWLAARQPALESPAIRAVFDAGWNARGKTLADVLNEINEGLYAIHDVLEKLCPRGFPIERSEHTPEQWQIKMAYHHVHNAEKLIMGRPDVS